jgi:hypothetical protein
MARVLTVLIGLVAAIPALPAAPVPAHLFPRDQTLYYPTQKGTRWVYEGSTPYTLVITGAEKDEKNGATIITTAHVWPDRKQQQPQKHQKLAVSGRGVLWLEDINGAFDTPVWLLKSAARAREEWAFTTSGPAIANTKGVVRVGGYEDVETGAGKFSAVRIEREVTVVIKEKGTHSYRETNWYAPGVGMVKWTSGRSWDELKSFTPGKD